MYVTRSPPIGWAGQNAAPLNFTISADSQIQRVISLLVILRQTVTELWTSMPTAPVLRAFVQYLIAHCRWPEAASGVIFGMFVDPTGMKVHVKFCDSRSNRSEDIRLPHFVTNGRRTDYVTRIHFVGRAFRYSTPSVWNALNRKTRSCSISSTQFKRHFPFSSNILTPALTVLTLSASEVIWHIVRYISIIIIMWQPFFALDPGPNHVPNSSTSQSSSIVINTVIWKSFLSSL